MSRIAIKAENISKQYRLGEIGTGTISHDLNRWWHKVRGKEDPFLKIGETNDRSQKSVSDYVWSLKDINFEINKGDTVGIIGKNGAGKSTLLKLLSKVTKPTTGQFKINGRIASLLEVGTGFHPEMTGRENIYLNGAILGMHRSEITRKFDEIVDFSGIERYIDTPVKRYSSGMYVRLAFAVAAHLESEILIVDEVLAVGDAEFQKKCLGKMGDVSLGEGRTVLFVSHNMSAIKQICKTGIFLENGMVKMNGDMDDVVVKYIHTSSSDSSFIPIKIPEIDVLVKNIVINREENGVILPFKPFKVEIELEADRDIEKIGIQIMLSTDEANRMLFASHSKTTNSLDLVLKKGANLITCNIESFDLCSGRYVLGFGVDRPFFAFYYHNLDVITFEVPEVLADPRMVVTNAAYGLVYLKNNWDIKY
jgi:lipopolysaccharide transport system ATP-binding protein